jgi:hypothetical protein
MLSIEHYLKIYNKSKTYLISKTTNPAILFSGMLKFDNKISYMLSPEWEGDYGLITIRDDSSYPLLKHDKDITYNSTTPSIERPICLQLFGLDDTSYIHIFKTFEEAIKIKIELEIFEPIDGWDVIKEYFEIE